MAQEGKRRTVAYEVQPGHAEICPFLAPLGASRIHGVLFEGFRLSGLRKKILVRRFASHTITSRVEGWVHGLHTP